MKLLFIGNNYPPEVAPLATRASEHAKYWTRDGHVVTMLTDVPNFPEGIVYQGYENTFTIEEMDRVEVARVPFYITANKGVKRRIGSFISFMLSCIWFSRRLDRDHELVVASSPQFFSAIAGYVISRMRGVPFVLEVRDMWPDSIVEVGAMKRNAIIRFFERIEKFLYRKAACIIVVTRTLKELVIAKGVPAEKVHIVKNGANLEAFGEDVDPEVIQHLKDTYHLHNRFVASYIGTIGMAHKVEVVYEAAKACQDENIVFVVMGTGAERSKLEQLCEQEPLNNFILLDKQDKTMVRAWLAISNACIVHLKKSPLFKGALPSKMFEAMVMKKPILLGLEGEAEEMLKKADAGITFEPENPAGLARAAERLCNDPARCAEIGKAAYDYLLQYHDREKLAGQFIEILEQVGNPSNLMSGDGVADTGVPVLETTRSTSDPA